MKNDAAARTRTTDQIGSLLFESSPDCVKVLDAHGHIVAMNQNGRCAMEVDDFGTVCGISWKTIWPARTHRDIDQAVASACIGKVGHFNSFCPTAKGSTITWSSLSIPASAKQYCRNYGMLEPASVTGGALRCPSIFWKMLSPQHAICELPDI